MECIVAEPTAHAAECQTSGTFGVGITQNDVSEYTRDGVEEQSKFHYERTGVTHLVHAWAMKGHPVRRSLLQFSSMLTTLRMAV